jgi:predicted lipoprotein with Yx(FWY)xxD motif
VGGGTPLSTAASWNCDCALAAKTPRRSNVIVAFDLLQQQRSTMQANHDSNSLSGGTPRRALVATAAALAALGALIFVLLHPMGSHAAASSGPSVSTASTGLGRIVVNSGGRTLYMFSKDGDDKSACAGMCARFWPPLIAAGKPRASADARGSLLGTTKRADGRTQVTYNRHPLYTFVKDTKKGQTQGEGLTAFGGQWNAVSPVGTKVESQAKPKPRPQPKPIQSGIPQNNGGDHDSDNNGGPSDGDGNI